MWRVFPESLRAVLGSSMLMAIARDPGSAGSESGSAAAALHSARRSIVWSAVATLPLWLTQRGGMHPKSARKSAYGPVMVGDGGAGRGSGHGQGLNLARAAG